MIQIPDFLRKKRGDQTDEGGQGILLKSTGEDFMDGIAELRSLTLAHLIGNCKLCDGTGHLPNPSRTEEAVSRELSQFGAEADSVYVETFMSNRLPLTVDCYACRCTGLQLTKLGQIFYQFNKQLEKLQSSGVIR